MEPNSFTGNNIPETNGASVVSAAALLERSLSPKGQVFTLSGVRAIPGGEQLISPMEFSTDPISVRVVEHDICVRANLLIWDHDETISEGTGEHFHDGHVARFARGLSQYLISLHARSEEGILTEEHLKTFADTGSIFSPEEWLIYRGESGKSEDGVLRGMLRIAEERFELQAKGVRAQVSEFSSIVETVSSEQFKDFMAPVRATEGTREILTDAGLQGIKSVVISASKHHYVMMMLEHNDLRGLVHTVIGNAQKKVNATTFEKKDMEAGCSAADVPPREAVMFGDSIGDIAAAARAGVGTIIIRTGRSLPCECPRGSGAEVVTAADAEHRRMRAQVDSFQQLEHYRTELLGHGYPITVLLVEEFSQVSFEGGVSPGENAVFYAPATVRH